MFDRNKESNPFAPENEGITWKKSEKAEYEMVNHPSHYNRYPIEAIEMARRIWGDEAMYTAAQITAFFYRMRLGLKPENSVEQELNKEEFWLNYAKNIAQDLGGKEKDQFEYDKLMRKICEIK